MNLVEAIVIKYFSRGLVELSQDKVVNVRISLAECFYSLQVRMEELEEEAVRLNKQLNAARLKNKEISQTDLQYLEQFQAITNKMNIYLNQNFFQVLCNLKADRSSCVAEFMEAIYIQEECSVTIEELEETYDYEAPGQRVRQQASSFIGAERMPNIEEVPSTTEQLDEQSNEISEQIESKLGAEPDAAVEPDVDTHSDLLNFDSIDELRRLSLRSDRSEQAQNQIQERI